VRSPVKVEHDGKDIVSFDRQDRIPQLVNTRKAAEILGRSPATLKRWRYEGIGPDYVEMEGRVSRERTFFPALKQCSAKESDGRSKPHHYTLAL
jgi:hypothetical protein